MDIKKLADVKDRFADYEKIFNSGEYVPVSIATLRGSTHTLLLLSSITAPDTLELISTFHVPLILGSAKL